MHVQLVIADPVHVPLASGCRHGSLSVWLSGMRCPSPELRLAVGGERRGNWSVDTSLSETPEGQAQEASVPCNSAKPWNSGVSQFV